jgi:hypothetical protein
LFELLPGHRFDTVGMPPLIKGLALDVLIAAKTFDSDAIMADLNERGAKVVISQHPRRAKRLVIDEEMYKWRHLIEIFFCKLKRIAMRSDKTDQSVGTNPWRRRSFRNNRSAAALSRLGRTRISKTSPSPSTPRHRYICIPESETTISSRYHRV